MTPLLTSLLIVLLLFFNSNAVTAETQTDELPECIVITHCVRENWETSDAQKSFDKAVEAVENTPRTKIVEKTKSYLHAEVQTRWRRYTDDLLIKALPKQGILQIRSESRVGIGDNGVNKKRVDELAYRLMTNQTNLFQ